MGFKKMDSTLGFADFALASSLKHNRSLKLMVKLDKSIEWSQIESILIGHYTRPLHNPSKSIVSMIFS